MKIYRKEADSAETRHLIIGRNGAAVVDAARLEAHAVATLPWAASALGPVADTPLIGFLGYLLMHALRMDATQIVGTAVSIATLGAVDALHAANMRLTGN